MQVRLEKSWQNQLYTQFNAPYFKALTHFVREEYKQFRCFPSGKYIFNALDATPFDRVRVVILGQDPYHGEGQAHGLSFSVPEGVTHPPSLVNIFKELETDVGKPYPKSGTLTSWATQGVLLLNATLSVRSGQAGSHQNRGWEQFTDAIISAISANKTGVVFLLWGNYAKKKGKHIDRTRHLILEAGHPSPLSANRGLWFGNKHFSKANAYLLQQGTTPIVW
jgi:uracil-DNA glycosylase